jgi:lysozyme
MVNVNRVFEEIKADEGMRNFVYKCSLGHNTIGCGHLILDTDPESKLEAFDVNADDVPEDQCISDHRIYELFQEDIHLAINACSRIYSNWEELPEEAQHVLINMCFQLGEGGLSKFKATNAAVEAQAWGQMALEMVDSKWARDQTPARAHRLKDRIQKLCDQ